MSVATIPEATYEASVNYLNSLIPDHFKKPKLGVICGSGLGGLVDTIDPSSKIEIPYHEIPGFKSSTVAGHSGKLVFGYLGEHKTVTVFMVGRVHLYEGYTPQECAFPVRVMHLLGVKVLVVTNACGGLSPDLKVCDIVVINDHLSMPSMTGQNPLCGPNLEGFGIRFPAVSDTYTYALRKLAFRAAFETGIAESNIREGVYGYTTGPMFETRSEARFLASIGADVVGMSTVHETIAARHAGMKVLCLSLVTNIVVTGRGRDAKKEPDTDQTTANHLEVLQSSARRADDLQRMVKRFADLWVENEASNTA
ncbi:purine nucleoside phosphorylase [Dichotomocladium elegans]|nr:purine nucleoside phosphorylase [Dichotomocladium elegans]